MELYKIDHDISFRKFDSTVIYSFHFGQKSVVSYIREKKSSIKLI